MIRETPKDFEKIEESPMPGTLDVIKIDGRWAQTFSTRGDVIYLDNGDYERINFNKYKYKKIMDVHSVEDLVKKKEVSDEEFKNVRWAEGEESTYLKGLVIVFGEYTKK